MLIDILAHHAKWSGEKVALVSRDGEPFSYSRSYAAVRSLAAALRNDFPEMVGKAPVAIALSDRRQHFLLTIALEYLGIPSLPFVFPLDPGVSDGLQYCPTLICDQQIAGFTGRQIVLDKAWLQWAEAASPHPNLAHARWRDRELAILIVTSGSTGAAKCIRLSYQARLLREANRAWRYAFSPATRYLIGLPISVSNVFLSARAVLRSAGTVVFLTDDAMERAFDGITHTTLLPSHLRTILEALPQDYRHPEPIRVMTVGAPLAQSLREKAERMLHAEIESNYGCNELGGCGLIGRDGIGYVVPGTDMKIVDANQNQVANGTSGVIWVRSEEIAEGYTDEMSTRAQFIDGWFVTGDVGVMLEQRTFKLLGRADDLMNLGGQKVAPDAFEGGLLALGIARDVAITSIPGAQGIEQICICVAQPLVDNTELLSRIGSLFGANTGDIAVLIVDKIARNATGKIQRRQMQDLASARARLIAK
jgi:acyl-coenzyme A synthetase/AMP-(fatty) acid ligase